MILRPALILTALVGALLSGCDEYHPPPYEHAFSDYIHIDYPPGQRWDAGQTHRDTIDEILRTREHGYVDGIMGAGINGDPDVLDMESMVLAVDFSLVQPEALIRELTDKGLLPTDISFRHDNQY